MVAKSRRSPLDTLLRRPVAVAITVYQRRLSPLKGFSCAHRVLHGGDSCSQHAKALVLRLGPLAALTPARERLGACREANKTLRTEARAGSSTASSWEIGRRRQGRRRWFRWRRRRSRDAAEDLFESEDSGGDASGCESESIECDSCDCGLDCSP